MHRKHLLYILPFLLFSSAINGQNPDHKSFGQDAYNIRAEEQCAHTSIHENLMATDPDYAREQMQREQSLAQLVAQFESGAISRSNEILTIPVVVHIVHKGEAIGTGTNITDAQVYSAINGLNEDYRKMTGTWGDGDGVDSEIEFCLAQRDPGGNAHNGINRVNGCTVTDYCTEGITAGQGQGANQMDVKNLSRWPNQQYYNIWVVSEIENNNGGSGIQGYAYFPTTSQVDGTVVLFNAFGTVGNLKSYTNRNRTLTHELGHAFALFHTFQGTSSCSNETNCALQGDRVCDTPPTTLNSNCSNPACGGTQQVNNYMDYTSQLCKNMFTEGQKARMRLAIQNSRPNLLTSNGCEPVVTALADAAITSIERPLGSTCSNMIQPVVTLSNEGGTTLSTATIQYRTGGAWLAHNWTGLLGSGQSANITLPEFNGGWGDRTLEIRVVNPNGGADANNADNLMTKPYTAVQNGNDAMLVLTLDNIGAQNSWLVRDTDGNVMAAGGPYSNFQNGTVYNIPICLPNDCYEFVINDSGNNGMCCASGNGGYVLLNSEGMELGSGSNFGSQDVLPFCIEDPSSPPPTANFSSSQTQICAGSTVTFESTSTGQIDNYAWQFTGGSPASSGNASPGAITYNTPGTYTVQLTVSNAGGSDVETKTAHITVLANETWYADNDGDGYGDANNTQESCTQPAGYVGNADDCNDNDAGDWDSCYDCAGVMNGSAYVDDCGTCDDIPGNDCDICDDLIVTLVQSTNPSCQGGANGSINIQVSSFTGVHSVSWSNGGTGTTLSGLSAGTYTATATSGTCTETLNVVINEGALANQTWYADNDGDGFGDPDNSQESCTQPTGYVGNAGDCNDNDASDWDSCYDCEGVMNGSAYADACGICDDNPDNDCIPCDELSIVLIQSTNPSCQGDLNGSITIQVESFSGEYSVSWSNGDSGTSLSGLGAGSYTATATSGTCSMTFSVTLNQPEAITIQVNNIQHVACEEENTGAAGIAISGGTGAIVLEAFGGQVSPGAFANLAAGTYPIIATDENGCTASATINILQLPCDSLAVTALNAADCGAIEKSFFEVVQANEVPAAESYAWQISDAFAQIVTTFNTEDAQFLPAEVANILPFETYQVRVKGIHTDLLSDWGETCEISFGIATTSLVEGDCGNMSLDEDAYIICTAVNGAEQYEYRFEEVLTGERTYGYSGPEVAIALGSVEDLEPGLQYLVDVRARYRNTWANHGPSCVISIMKNIEVPVIPEAICNNYNIIAENGGLSLQPINGASVYALEFSGSALFTPVEFENDVHVFGSDLLANLPKGDTLTIRTRAYVNEAWTPWSEICNMAFANDVETLEEYTMNLFLFPNPILSGNSVNTRMNGDWDNVQITLRNLAGVALAQVQSDYNHMEPQQLELPKIEAGIYFITAVHGTSTLTKKLIVQ